MGGRRHEQDRRLAVRICTPDNGISDNDWRPSTRLVADPAKRQSLAAPAGDKTFNASLK
jgi:hypothetical protein